MSYLEQLSKQIDQCALRKTMLIGCAVALILIPLDALWMSWQRKTMFAPDKKLFKRVAPILLGSQEVYMGSFEKNTIFGVASSGQIASALWASLSEQSKDYRLKGILLAEESEAIVEDAKTQKTLFVKKGDKLGELVVKDIKGGYIVLAYLNEEIKLEMAQVI